MIEIYSIPVSLYCAKLRILLRYKGLEYVELLPPGGYGSDLYKKIVPSGNLPAMSANGLMLSDSEAIAEYLEEAYSKPTAFPETIHDRAKVRELGRFHDTRLEPAVRATFSLLSKEGKSDPSLPTKFAIINQKIDQLDSLLAESDVWNTSQFLMSDCGFAVTFNWISKLSTFFDQPVIWPARVTAFRRRIEEKEAVRSELREYLPRMTHYFESMD